MIKEIQAKTLLAHVRQPDTWFGLKYNMNLYRGCQHHCIYCDSRSTVYGIENFHDVLVKVNAIERLRDELPRKRVKGTIGTGAMSDPYIYAERHYNLTGQALEAIAEFGFGVHIITKSAMVLKDIAVLKRIADVHAVVSFSFSTVDDAQARLVEPAAPLPSARLEAMHVLSAHGIHTGAAMMPVLPFLQDSPENIGAIVDAVAAHGGHYIIPGMGMTLRDGQREYFYAQLEMYFPGLRAQYTRTFGNSYFCPPRNPDALWTLFNARCAQHGISTRVPAYKSEPVPQQMALF